MTKSSTTKAVRLDKTPEWSRLAKLRRAMEKTHLRSLFAKNPARAKAFSLEVGDLYLDYSKNRIDANVMQTLLALAKRAGLGERIAAMFEGEKINVTENRAVLHRRGLPSPPATGTRRRP